MCKFLCPCDVIAADRLQLRHAWVRDINRRSCHGVVASVGIASTRDFHAVYSDFSTWRDVGGDVTSSSLKIASLTERIQERKGKTARTKKHGAWFRHDEEAWPPPPVPFLATFHIRIVCFRELPDLRMTVRVAGAIRRKNPASSSAKCSTDTWYNFRCARISVLW